MKDFIHVSNATFSAKKSPDKSRPFVILIPALAGTNYIFEAESEVVVVLVESIVDVIPVESIDPSIGSEVASVVVSVVVDSFVSVFLSPQEANVNMLATASNANTFLIFFKQ